MNATYTTRYNGHLHIAGLEKVAAWTKELGPTAKAAAMLLAAPLLGLAFVIVLPFAGLALLAWMAIKAAAKKWTVAARIAKRIALFAAAPFIGLAYFIAFPFVALGALAYYGIRATRR